MKNNETAGLKRIQELNEVRGRTNGADRKIGEIMLVRSWIDNRRLEIEPDLADMAWFEYRYMTPLERTEIFTKEYLKSYLDAYAKAHPEEDITKKRPINPIFVANDPRVMNALWNARASADYAGVPYDVYLDVVINGHLINDKWKRPPRPNQLYGKLDIPRLQDLPTREMAEDRLFGPDWDRNFLAEAYRADVVQDTTLRYMKRVVERAPDPVKTLTKFLCERKAITVERAKELFGDEMVTSAMALSTEIPVERPGETRKHIPACVGYPDLDDPSACQICAVRKQCLQLHRVVKQEMVRVYGSEDPRREWKKELSRNRQQRHRDKKKEVSFSELMNEDDRKPEDPGSQPNDRD